MGQAISNQFEGLKDDVIKEAHIFKEIMEITHEEFLAKVKELNRICRKFIECESRKLYFFVKKKSDTTFLWKQTVRITCMRVVISDDGETICDETINEHLATSEEEVEFYKVLTLRQFLIAFKMILYHFNCIQEAGLPTEEEKNASLISIKPISTSMILDKIMASTEKAEAEECIICMERKPEITLPCAHAYCLFCIEQWNVSNKTCPMCRAEVGDTDDSWVTPDIPKPSDVNAEIQKALTILTLKLPNQHACV